MFGHLGLALDSVRFNSVFKGPAAKHCGLIDFRTIDLCAAMIHTPVGGNKSNLLPFDATGVVIGKLLLLYCHGEFQMFIGVGQTIESLAQDITEPFLCITKTF